MAEPVKYTVEYYMDKYEAAVRALSSYVPWLESKLSQDVSSDYKESESTMAFLVFDPTLLSFVKQAENTGLIDRNCVYIYSRRNIKNSQDELNFINRAQLKDMDDLWGILSFYIIEGRTRGAKWSEGVTNGVYAAVITKMLDLLTVWSKEATAKR